MSDFKISSASSAQVTSAFAAEVAVVERLLGGSRMVSGSTQKDRARSEGLCEALALMLTERRVAKYPLWDYVPMVDQYDLIRLFREEEEGPFWLIRMRHTEQTNALSKITGEDASERRKALRDLADEQYYSDVSNMLERVATLPQDHLASYELSRKEKVRKGELAPEPTDTDWLVEEAGKLSDEQRRLQAIAKKAESARS